MKAPRLKDWLIVLGSFAVLTFSSWAFCRDNKNENTKKRKMKQLKQRLIEQLKPIHLLYGLYGIMILVCLLIKGITG